MTKLNYFNFKKLNDQILLTNDLGKYIFLEEKDFKKIISGKIEPDSVLEQQLLRSRMVYKESDVEYVNRTMYEMMNIKGHVNAPTALHIFVVTTACNMNCIYCQANSGMSQPNQFMSKETAEHAVDIALQSPAKRLSFEFQGGEPLANFDIVKHIIEYTEKNKDFHIIDYNIVSNLTLLNKDILKFLIENNIGISTSLDGPQDLHDRNRCFIDGSGTFDIVRKHIGQIRDAGGHVGAIQTTTRYSLDHPESIIETYAELGFDSVFVRPLTPLGKALLKWDEIGYTAEEFCDFYGRILNAAMKINKKGMVFKEQHAAILLRRINGYFVNYMELRSPCGAGTGQLAYYPDGNVFTCDEGRMVYEMGQDTFRLGNVYKDSFRDVVSNSVCKTVCTASILESIPSCCDCVYQPYCGTCPVVNYAMSQDVIEKQPKGFRCKIYKGILDNIFSILQKEEPEEYKILMSWIN